MNTQLGSSRFDPRRGLLAFILMALFGAGAAAAQVTGRTLVTAVKDGSGNLKLISWSIGGNQIRRLNAEGASAGAVSRISSVRVGKSDSGRMVTAVRDGGNNLKLILWNTGFNGTITRSPGRAGQAGEVTRIAAAAPPANAANVNRVVTAVRDGSGNLKVIGWKVEGNDVNRAPQQIEALAGPVDVVLTTFPPRPLDNVISATFLTGNLLATAVRGRGGNLRINTWNVADDGTVTRRRELSAEAVREVSAVPLGVNRLITAVSDGNGNLKVIAWDVDAAGNITRRGQATAGAASQIAAFPLRNTQFATALRNGAGNLMVITFNAPPGPTPIARLDDASAGTVSLIAASRCGDPTLSPIGTLPLQTSVRDGGGDLKIIGWRTNTNATTVDRIPGADESAGEVGLISTVCFLQ